MILPRASTHLNPALVFFCVCQLQVGVLSKRMNESSCVLASELAPMLKEISDIYKNKETSLWNVAPKSGLRKISFGISIVETCYCLRPSSDGRPLVYHSNHQAPPTARCRRAGLLATADTCVYTASMAKEIQKEAHVMHAF